MGDDYMRQVTGRMFGESGAAVTDQARVRNEPRLALYDVGRHRPPRLASECPENEIGRRSIFAVVIKVYNGWDNLLQRRCFFRFGSPVPEQNIRLQISCSLPEPVLSMDFIDAESGRFDMGERAFGKEDYFNISKRMSDAQRTPCPVGGWNINCRTVKDRFLFRLSGQGPHPFWLQYRFLSNIWDQPGEYEDLG